MSREDDDERQYQCLRKYEEIVKQLIEMVDARTRAPKRRRVSSSSRGNNGAAPSRQGAGGDDVLVQTITRFLHDLDTNLQTEQ